MSSSRRITRRQARAAGLSTVVAGVVALAVGIAYAFFSTSTSSANSFSLGTVSLGSPVNHTCTYTALQPGDLTGSQTCSLGVTYTGSLSAYMSLTVAIQSKAGSAANAKPLYDGTNSTGLTLSISDGHKSFTVPTNPANASGCPATYTCWTESNDLAAWYGGTGTLVFGSGNGATWTVTPLFPKGVGNSYQGGTATVTLTAQAVQAPANPLPATCTTSTIGEPCPATGSFSWSS